MCGGVALCMPVYKNPSLAERHVNNQIPMFNNINNLSINDVKYLIRDVLRNFQYCNDDTKEAFKEN